MTIAIEPMICQGDYHVKVLDDGWTTVTADGKLAAHYENTIAITEKGPVILTAATDKGVRDAGAARDGRPQYGGARQRHGLCGARLPGAVRMDQRRKAPPA